MSPGLIYEMEQKNRQVVFDVLEKIRETEDPVFLEQLEEWRAKEVRKVRERISSVQKVLKESQENGRRIAVLFPGIGYTCDKPLLYYAGKLASENGYQVKTVPYGNFPSGVKGNPEKMRQAFFSALDQAEALLKDMDWGAYDDILFISKSVGTIVSAYYLRERKMKVRSISFTPLEDTFTFAGGDGIMFHGTQDPWAKDSKAIEEYCEKIGQPLYITENGNHSLETGDVKKDLQNMQKIMEQVDEYIKIS